jgi:hypothetical protein
MEIQALGWGTGRKAIEKGVENTPLDKVYIITCRSFGRLCATTTKLERDCASLEFPIFIPESPLFFLGAEDISSLSPQRER